MNHPQIQGVSFYCLSVSALFGYARGKARGFTSSASQPAQKLRKSCIVTSLCLMYTIPSVSLYSSERCQQEIDKVLDGKDQASFEDKNQMPYVQVEYWIIFI